MSDILYITTHIKALLWANKKYLFAGGLLDPFLKCLCTPDLMKTKLGSTVLD